MSWFWSLNIWIWFILVQALAILWKKVVFLSPLESSHFLLCLYMISSLIDLLYQIYIVLEGRAEHMTVCFPSPIQAPLLLQAFLFLSSILPKHCFSHFPNVFLSFLSFRDITVAASSAPAGTFQLSLTTSRNSSEARSHIASKLNLLCLGLPISSGEWYVVQHWTVNYFDLGQWETVFPLCWNKYPIKSSKRRILSYVAPMKILSIIGRSIMARSCRCWTFPYPGRFHPLLFFLLGIALCWNFPQDLR